MNNGARGNIILKIGGPTEWVGRVWSTERSTPDPKLSIGNVGMRLLARRNMRIMIRKHVPCKEVPVSLGSLKLITPSLLLK
jgi:hypothetical protein